MSDFTYIMLKPRKVGGEIRQPGELVPEAAGWKNRQAYLNRSIITPIPVANLTADQRKVYEAWLNPVETNVEPQRETTFVERIGAMSIDEIKTKVNQGTLDAVVVWEAESEGRQRSTLMNWLEEQAEDEE